VKPWHYIAIGAGAFAGYVLIRHTIGSAHHSDVTPTPLALADNTAAKTTPLFPVALASTDTQGQHAIVLHPWQRRGFSSQSQEARYSAWLVKSGRTDTDEAVGIFRSLDGRGYIDSEGRELRAPLGRSELARRNQDALNARASDAGSLLV
jgi:hypothetical protein